MSPEPCTTQSRRLRHLSVDLHPSKYTTNRGRWGTTLCGYDGAHDEEYVKAEIRSWASDPDRAARFSLAALRPCTRCANKAEVTDV